MLNPPIDPSQIWAHLKEAERHVRDGEARVEKQRELLSKLRDGGHPTEEAETLLARFRDILAEQVSHRDRLREEARGKAI